MRSNNNYDVIIIGAGPAGMTSAIYLKRAGINPLILEQKAPGGTLNKTTKIENYPGYIDKDGTTLAFKMYSQIEDLGIDLKLERVLDIKRENDLYKIITKECCYNTKFIIIATGKTPKKLDVAEAEKFEGKGISYCAICDGALYKNKIVSVVGGGNSAMESALYLSDIADKVYIINRSLTLRSTEKDKEEVLKKDNVEIIYNSKIEKIMESDGKLVGIKLNNGRNIEVDSIFVCIGQDYNISYYQNLNIKTDKSGIIVDSEMKTSAYNVYACGDAISKSLYQVVTATGEGAIAASSIIKSIKNKSY